MFSIASLLFLAIASHARPEARENQHHSEYLRTCHKIAKDISSASQVFFPRARLVLFPANPTMLIINQAAPQYTSDISHFALSSIQESACSVEPGSVEDVSKIVSKIRSDVTGYC
jgi:hypothetical protein